jgi:hypothetical protein
MQSEDGTTGRISTTTDLWTADQTKASFMGITAHWIEIDKATGEWLLSSSAIAFRSIAGAHDGANLAQHFIGLCGRAGIINLSVNNSKVRYALKLIV